MSAAVVEGNDAVTGHIISTTIGGKNGEPKRVGLDFQLYMFDVYELQLMQFRLGT